MTGWKRALASVWVFLAVAVASPVWAAPAAPSLAQYLGVRSASAPAMSPDGARIAYLSNVSGTNQIWLVPAAGGPPKQLTSFPDRVQFVTWSPDGRGLLFGKDSKGDERTQLHLLDVQSGAVRDLTRDPKAIHDFGGFSPDGKMVAWSSNARDQAFFDVYVHVLASGETRCVRKADETCHPRAWSPDGRQLVVRRDLTNLDNELLLVDVADGATRALTPHKGEADYSSVCWPEGARRIWFLTNEGNEFTRIAVRDVDGAFTEYVGPRVTWDVTDLALTRDGRWMAWVTNEDAFGKLRLSAVGDLTTAHAVAMPPGVQTGLSFARSAPALAVSWMGPRNPSAVYAMKASDTSPREVVSLGLDGIPADSLVEPQLVHYPTFDGKQIPALLYLPRSKSAAPVIISVHGGPEGQERPVWSGVYQYLVARGYAILAPNIRGSLGYGKTYTHLDDARKRGDAIEDVARAVAWLRGQKAVDGARVAVMGGSYGGYMTLAQVAFHPELYAAAVDIVGMSDFETFLKNTGAWRRRYRIAEYGDPEKDAAYLRKYSPIHKVGDIKAPLMVVQGAQDPRVPKSEADQIVASLRALGRPVEYLVFDDEGHGLARLPNRIKAYTAIADFFDKYLRKQAP